LKVTACKTPSGELVIMTRAHILFCSNSMAGCQLLHRLLNVQIWSCDVCGKAQRLFKGLIPPIKRWSPLHDALPTAATSKERINKDGGSHKVINSARGTSC
jgi:hypothetical protein